MYKIEIRKSIRRKTGVDSFEDWELKTTVEIPMPPSVGMIIVWPKYGRFDIDAMIEQIMVNVDVDNIVCFAKAVDPADDDECKRKTYSEIEAKSIGEYYIKHGWVRDSALLSEPEEVKKQEERRQKEYDEMKNQKERRIQ